MKREKKCNHSALHRPTVNNTNNEYYKVIIILMRETKRERERGKTKESLKLRTVINLK